jgi:hypothetical protein
VSRVGVVLAAVEALFGAGLAADAMPHRSALRQEIKRQLVAKRVAAKPKRRFKGSKAAKRQARRAKK